MRAPNNPTMTQIVIPYTVTCLVEEMPCMYIEPGMTMKLMASMNGIIRIDVTIKCNRNVNSTSLGRSCGSIVVDTPDVTMETIIPAAKI